MEEISYKYLQKVLKPFVNSLSKNVGLSDIFTNEELLELFTNRYYEYSKNILENLLPEEDKFYNLLINAGRNKELLVNPTKEIKFKTVIDCGNPDTLGKDLNLISQEYVDFVLNNLRDRVIWLINEYNDLNPDNPYVIEDIVT